jgi:hypothetical protein
MYYINPIWFYLIGIADQLKGVEIATCIISASVGLFSIFPILMNYDVLDFKHLDDGNKMLIKVFKTCVITIIIMVILAVFTPSSQTCEKMLISSVVTHENVESTKENAKEFVDYLFEKIEELETNNIPKE